MTGQLTPPASALRFPRESAIASGSLLDITAAAREAGFLLPLAISSAAWAAAVAGRCSGEAEILQRVLSAAAQEISRPQAADEAPSSTRPLPVSLEGGDAALVGVLPLMLAVRIECGDHREQVLTITLPDGD
jgi:hypothetical protein